MGPRERGSGPPGVVDCKRNRTRTRGKGGSSILPALGVMTAVPTTRQTPGMKQYGSKRRDKKTCPYGCCGAKAHPYDSGWFRGSADVDQIRKAFRHRARQEGRREANELGERAAVTTRPLPLSDPTTEDK